VHYRQTSHRSHDGGNVRRYSSTVSILRAASYVWGVFDGAGLLPVRCLNSCDMLDVLFFETVDISDCRYPVAYTNARCWASEDASSSSQVSPHTLRSSITCFLHFYFYTVSAIIQMMGMTFGGIGSMCIVSTLSTAQRSFFV
jgi:hypothetical protein